ncbi:uncharacterized protein MKK02DRAFT_38656 [Dioszegia hungarica]|uniref:Aldehyde dehydrogenase domain-containing protein n=1 Tax=Dioszegia hungarica TaxID=4972 RepID=A0AA38H7W0_9TREE|nr:uncharacterized protein MKK02DRAFT_38656 [Dioszegia hungarica]KAI9633984.1 hypothetical protein MKK02DRAFT_38656 [Dioszegia hungarica]
MIPRYLGRPSRHLNASVSKCRRHLSSSATRAALPRVPLYIGGRAVESSSVGTVTNCHAKTGEKSCEVVVAGEEETYNAIRSSKEAFGVWRDTQPYERRKILLKAR